MTVFDVCVTCGLYAVSETDLDASSSQGANVSLHHQLSKESNAGVESMSSTNAEELVSDGNLLNQQPVPDESAEPLSLSSVPEPASSEEPVGPVLNAEPADSFARRKYFPPHWSADSTNKALEVA